MPVIGVIGAGERGGFADLLVATRLGLKDFGFVEGQNFELEYAFAVAGSKNFQSLPAISYGGRSRSLFLPALVLGSPPRARDDPVKLGFVQA